MSNRAIAMGLFAALGLLVCLVMWGRADLRPAGMPQVPVQGTPQKFPRPADMRGVIRQITAPDGTIKLFCPKGSVTLNPDSGMAGETVVIIKYVEPVPASPGK